MSSHALHAAFDGKINFTFFSLTNILAYVDSYLLQLQAHLQELTTVAVRAHLDDARPQAHPHTIEAARQISGDIFGKDDAKEVFPGKSQPHLLHEPYMSEEGAGGMLRQTLADVAEKVDQEAEARGTLESTEFGAFRALVGSVYIGSLQKRAECVESRERHQQKENKEKEKKSAPPLPTKTPTAKKVENDDGGEPEPGRPSLPEEHDSNDAQHENGGVDRRREGNGDDVDNGDCGGDGAEDDKNADVGDTVEPGVARLGHQACSGDIAQALVAIAMGEGFEDFASSSVSAGGGDSNVQANRGGNGRTDGTGEHSTALAKGQRGGYGRGATGVGGAKGLKSGGGGCNSFDDAGDAQQQHLERLHRQRDSLGQAAAGLQYLSEDAAAPLGGRQQPSKYGGSGHGVGSEAEGQFPGLEWLAPHIIGRSIPMELR